jgi:hypothetical protein
MLPPTISPLRGYLQHHAHAAYLELLQDDDNDDPQYMPPCPAAQQCTGVLFGFLLGYSNYLLWGPSFVCCVFIGFGSVFGLLGSRVASPLNIRGEEFVTLGGCSIFVAICCKKLLYLDLVGVFLTAVLSSIATSVMFMCSRMSSRLPGQPVKAQSFLV